MNAVSGELWKCLKFIGQEICFIGTADDRHLNSAFLWLNPHKTANERGDFLLTRETTHLNTNIAWGLEGR